jgi:hypothetical protein
MGHLAVWRCGVCDPPTAGLAKAGLVIRRDGAGPTSLHQVQISPAGGLTDVETGRLAELEQIVDRGLKTFVEVGQALSEIRDSRLYRATHRTFEDYCRDRWGFSRQRGLQLIDAAEMTTIVVTAGLPAPANEAQAREMGRLSGDEEAIIATWREANVEAERCGDKGPTAKLLRSVIDGQVNSARRARHKREITCADCGRTLAEVAANYEGQGGHTGFFRHDDGWDRWGDEIEGGLCVDCWTPPPPPPPPPPPGPIDSNLHIHDAMVQLVGYADVPNADNPSILGHLRFVLSELRADHARPPHPGLLADLDAALAELARLGAEIRAYAEEAPAS